MGDRDRSSDRGARVYVGGLEDGVKKEDLEEEFQKFGKLNNVWIALNPPGFAFIEFGNLSDAEAACDSLNGIDFLGSKLRVEIAKGRSRGGGRGGGGGAGEDVVEEEEVEMAVVFATGAALEEAQAVADSTEEDEEVEAVASRAADAMKAIGLAAGTSTEEATPLEVEEAVVVDVAGHPEGSAVVAVEVAAATAPDPRWEAPGVKKQQL
ncbi:hypothetical protein D910_03986 [Dendroctonus ponderosae]|uniref:RRM domain-containing protein n=1 Tax=Dendroctonus ponderosae TaxID=77166 RepID=U4TY83_DENPD|nr:hypothetical protein D910_03986 [Dendroctonus ponderosae]